MLKLLSTLFLAVAAATTASAHGHETMFKAEEFGAVTNAAVAQFKIDFPTQYSQFHAVTLSRLIQGEEEVGLSVKIYVKGEDAAAPTILGRYNCHKHETAEIECHQQ